MNMTREEAIKWLNGAIHDTDTYWDSCSNALKRELDEQKEVFQLALSALRARSGTERCRWCETRIRKRLQITIFKRG